MPYFGSTWSEDTEEDNGIPLFSACSGECCDCSVHFWGGCIAGHGDDHFSEITEKEAIKIIEYKMNHKRTNPDWMVVTNELLKRFPKIKII